MELTPKHYREEVLKPFFKYVETGESFYVVGAPSIGKTRLMDFMMGDDPDALRNGLKPKEQDWVKVQYLSESLAPKIWLARVDMNRLRHESDWGFRFYELLLNTVLLACNRYNDSEVENVEKLKEELAELDAQVIESKDALMAHRLLEMAVSMICHTYGIKICFLFDEFDEIYQTMPKEVFAQLRAIRDANKYRISYILFLRNLPERLRVPLDNEGFYELISRNHVGIGPYSAADTLHVISQLEDRHGYVLDETKREWLKQFSGGHPGLIQALLKLLKDNSDASTQLGNMEWFARQEVVGEEFRKLWEGLLPEERDGLRAIAHGDPNAVSKQTEKLLEAKGLIKTSGGRTVFFTPLLGYWIIISKT